MPETDKPLDYDASKIADHKPNSRDKLRTWIRAGECDICHFVRIEVLMLILIAVVILF